MNKLSGLFVLILVLQINTSYSLQDSVVAIVNDKVILQSELNERMKEVNLQNLSGIEFAKIKNNILFVGLGKTFQIWEPKNFEKFNKKQKTGEENVVFEKKMLLLFNFFNIFSNF